MVDALYRDALYRHGLTGLSMPRALHALGGRS